VASLICYPLAGQLIQHFSKTTFYIIMTLISFAGALLFLVTKTPKPVVDSCDEAVMVGKEKKKDEQNIEKIKKKIKVKGAEHEIDTDGDHQQQAKVKFVDFKVHSAPSAAEGQPAKQSIEMSTGPNVARPVGFAMRIPDAA
jgi:hypothetical protein